MVSNNTSEQIKPTDETMDNLQEYDLVDEGTQTDDDHYSFENRFKRIGNSIL